MNKTVGSETPIAGLLKDARDLRVVAEALAEALAAAMPLLRDEAVREGRSNAILRAEGIMTPPYMAMQKIRDDAMVALQVASAFGIGSKRS